ncbi:MAG: AhpC/TSA family protein [Bacteroidia bacterium]|nr:MAG: AhpC/TSA family protein [Bacteroidia bacterium]
MKVPSYFPILVLLLLFVLACTRKETPDAKAVPSGLLTEIRGSLNEGSGERVLLEEMGAREYIPVDTVSCDSSGSFSIEFFPDQVAFYVLRYAQSGYITLLMEPGETLKFSGDFADAGSYSVAGSPGSELLRELAYEHKLSLDALGEIGRQNREHLSSPDYASLKLQLDRQFDSITTGFQNYSLRFIHDHPGSPAILIALYNLYGQGLPVFNPQTDLSVYQFVDSALTASHSGLDAVRLLHAQVNEAIRIMNSEPAVRGIQKGEIAPDFVSSRPDGSELALSDLKGNYVLLGFWAGWSGLSREENSTLKQAAERYGDKNFRILQVSLDDDRDTWTRAITEDGLEWEHVSDLMRWDTPVASIYLVEKIPYNVIIDPAGRVMATDLYGEKLLSTLDNLLNY